MSNDKVDMVNHPSHYTDRVPGILCQNYAKNK